MPTVVALLRAVNLGAQRKFPPAAQRAATEAAGGTAVETHLHTGNVRLTTRRRSRPLLEAALERAYLADRGFEVPTVVLGLAELATVAEDVERLGAGHEGLHYVSFLKHEPDEPRRAAAGSLSRPGERAVLLGRAVHLLVPPAGHRTRLSNATVERVLGTATNRNATVVRAMAAKWC